MTTRSTSLPLVRALAAACASAIVLSSCGAGDGDGDAQGGRPTLTLVTYSSFPAADTPLNEALDEFTAETGIGVRIAQAGDTGTMVNKAILTAGTPEGDVMWGVDNTFLSAAIDGGVFDGDPVDVDYGDVCVNYDIEWFDAAGLEPPSTLDDLLEPAYRDLLVVQDPTSSSPGLAFLLATIAAEGTRWPDYWTALVDNGVEVVDSWDIAYYERFSGYAGGSGDRPLVVSYGSSPPAEVILADPPRDDAATGVAAETCFRQIEYAGVLSGTDHPEEARLLVDFLRSERFQAELALTLFVYPALEGVALPDEFRRFAVIPDDPYTLDPAAIAENREQWQDRWSEIVRR